jgi:hypothetical protein
VQRSSIFNGEPVADPRFLYAERLPDGLIAVAGESTPPTLERVQVLPPNFADQLLCGVADGAGKCLGLAICSGIDFSRRNLMLYTPVPKRCIRIIQFGDLYSTGMDTSCISGGWDSSSLGNVYYEWKLLPRSLRMQKPCDHAQRVYSRNLAFSRCRQSERVLQEQDMVVCRSIHDLDAVDGLNILFDVYFLRMLDIMLNSFNHHRHNVALGIVAQPDQRQPVDLNLIAEP